MSEYTCPHCRKSVFDDEALCCPYCGENLERAIGFLGKLKYPTPRAIITIAILLVILAFVFIMM